MLEPEEAVPVPGASPTRVVLDHLGEGEAVRVREVSATLGHRTQTTVQPRHGPADTPRHTETLAAHLPGPRVSRPGSGCSEEISGFEGLLHHHEVDKLRC